MLADPTRNGLSLCKQEQVVGTSCLRVCAAHIESSERMDSNQGSRTFPIDVEVAYMKPTPSHFDLVLVVGVHGPGQTVLAVIGNIDGLIVVCGFDYGQDGSEDLFLGNDCARFDVEQNSRLYIEALGAARLVSE